ncbi:thiamine pyrophosphate-dependent enzyme [Chlorobium ferrooxidans]|uniref:2-oxoacid:acceptor oxidoreductase, beta subunit, pyruvate/2-ketoisovalerate n=1 Tax=Chlorobium ferrooxidans DSM 13031 TaxID=377431 RepID=Q0YRP7_9CHLB|nr:thiamine pyrophosphate-dependent enzyme [Chlorobium ferrooxidans]EAT58966.1 2-oxoacid:acceptor oxidoreductase, beta subunit, pyruvate/2-ketoisovalerate [Chlorobium ferrooxidans DSM 13031]
MKKTPTLFDMPLTADVAWCPGCGNYMLQSAVKAALHELAIDPSNLVMVSGIGQAAKAPQYLNVNMFNGLHGRSLPAALGIKLSNRNLVVVVESGDGDMYGEGGNHFIHAIRRNIDITVIVHNNMVYGLTKGQASPTSQRGMTTPVQVDGVMLEPFNPLAVALALNAPFIARAYAGDVEETKKMIMQAISFRGFSIVDVFQPCVIFNKVNTYQWFRENTVYLPESHDATDRTAAFGLATAAGKLPLGVLFRSDGREIYEELIGVGATRSISENRLTITLFMP